MCLSISYSQVTETTTSSPPPATTYQYKQPVIRLLPLVPRIPSSCPLMLTCYILWFPLDACIVELISLRNDLMSCSFAVQTLIRWPVVWQPKQNNSSRHSIAGLTESLALKKKGTAAAAPAWSQPRHQFEILTGRRFAPTHTHTLCLVLRSATLDCCVTRDHIRATRGSGAGIAKAFQIMDHADSTTSVKVCLNSQPVHRFKSLMHGEPGFRTFGDPGDRETRKPRKGIS